MDIEENARPLIPSRRTGGYMRRKRLLLPDRNGDPMESMGNLFDVAVLIGVGFLIMALSGIGLSDYLSGDNLTIVKNPGAANMEIITKTGNTVERLKTTGAEAQGAGTPIGTVYRLSNGDVVWVPGSAAP
jgi:hypothetical protein